MPDPTQQRAAIRRRVLAQVLLRVGVEHTTQHQLGALLERAGFAVTQATISRDLQRLGVYGAAVAADDEVAALSNAMRAAGMSSGRSHRPRRAQGCLKD